MRRCIGKALLLGLISALCLWGCGTDKSSRFYTLIPAGSAGNPSLAGPPLYIAISSVGIPDYLDRPQIVTRDGKDELKIAEFDRWAGELQNDITRVLAETLASSFPGYRVFILTGRHAMPADYSITVQVARFDPAPGQGVWLKAQWTVLEKESDKIVSYGESSLTEPLPDSSYQTIVTAMSRAVDRLGREIGAAFPPDALKVATESRATTGNRDDKRKEAPF